MKRLAGLCVLAALTVAHSAGAAEAEPPCSAGQERLRTAQMFLGAGDPNVTVSEAEFRQFADAELTPRFPHGLTVLDGGAQWRGPNDILMRRASKVVVIVLPPGGSEQGLREARDAYKARFGPNSVMTVVQDSCVAF